MAVSRTVLALRALGLGDVLTGIPALRGLRRAYPGSRLVLAAPAELATWLRGLGVVDDLVPTRGLEPLSWHGPAPDVAVNLHGRGPESHRLLQAVRPRDLVAFAAPDAGHAAGPDWPQGVHEVDRWCQLVRSVGGHCDADDLRLPGYPRGEHVVIHPGAAAGSRRWPAARWAQVAAHLAVIGCEVVVTGTAAEGSLCAAVADADPRVVDAAGAHDLGGLSRLVGSAALLLSGDTGVAHLATALGTPSVLLFGPVSPALWGPRIDADLHRVLWHALAGDPPGDAHGSALDPRLARTEVPEVLDAARRLLARRTTADAARPA